MPDLPTVPKNPLPLAQRLRAVRSHHTGTDTLRDAGGPVTLITLGPRWLTRPIVLATSPQGIRDISTARDGSIDKASVVNVELRRLIGANVFVSEHKEWLPRRRTLQPLFTHHNVLQLGEHIATAVESVCATWNTAEAIDLYEQCNALTIRILGQACFGTDLAGHADEVVNLLNVVGEYSIRRGTAPLRAPAWVPTPGRRQARAAAAGLRQLAEDILQACRDDPDLDAPLVRMLMAATDPDTGEALSDDAIAAELVIMLFAGYNSTATTLTYALWAVGRDPHIQERVAAEVAAMGDRAPSPSDAGNLTYTTQVIHEALRLCPPAATGTRVATRDVVVAGYRVPAGTTLAMGRRSVQRDPALWESPLVFDPERFSSEQVKNRDRWQYLPFGAGPRSCIGQFFAMQQATLALADIVRRFEIRPLGTEFPLSSALTVTPSGPVWAQIANR